MQWNQCKNILCIRADNMGDVIMSTPAFRALKETFGCRLTLLTSKAGSLITLFIKEIDETIVYDLPWVKTNNTTEAESCFKLIETLKLHQFDGVIIFTVYSQNPLPAALISYMANIPLRLAYCRENPYNLLTDWMPDKEPYDFIQHQAERDLNLAESIGASTTDKHLSLNYNDAAFEIAMDKLAASGFNPNRKYIIAHAGVSEAKRAYPKQLWIESLNIIQQQQNIQIILTGSKDEQALTQTIKAQTGNAVYNAAGLLNIEEFIALIAHSALVISVNTATVHIAAALKKPVIVLYAQTNPQHTPWNTKNILLPFSVPQVLKSKNEVIRFVDNKYFNTKIDYPSPQKIAGSVFMLMKENRTKIKKQFIVST